MSNNLATVKLRYEFLGLDDSIRDEAIALTIEGRNFERNSIEAIVGFGRVALRMQEILPHGEFINWLESEFKLSTAMAYNFINVAKKFGDQIPRIQELPISMTVLYQIAEPNAPKELVEQVINKAADGTKMSVKDVKELKTELKQVQQQSEEFEQEVLELLDERNELTDKIQDLQRQLQIQKGIIDSHHYGKVNVKKTPVNEFEEDEDELDDFEEDEDEFEDDPLEEDTPVIKEPAKNNTAQEVEDLEKKIKELRSADKELTKRIAEKEAKAALFLNTSPELREKKIKLEQFKLKVLRLLSDSTAEELMLSAPGMDFELVQWYESISIKFKSMSDICEKMVNDFKASHSSQDPSSPVDTHNDV